MLFWNIMRKNRENIGFVKVVLASVALLAAVVFPSGAGAQTNSINSYSPYTMFGIGEPATPGNAIMRSIGGVGVAMRSGQMASSLNPAGYSATMRKSFIFEAGVEGNFLVNRQTKYDAAGNPLREARNAKNTVNFHDLSVQFPLTKGLGMGVSVTPYSSVGYNMSATEQSEDIWGAIGRVSYNYMGDGDITEVKAGVGWEIFKGFSVGIAAKYYWGNIQHNYTATVTNDYVGSGTYLATVGLDDYAISNFKFQAGLQWSVIANEKRMLTLAATYDYGGSLNPKLTRNIQLNNEFSTEVIRENSTSQMRLPHQVAAGVMYQDSRFTAGVDYEYQAWGGNRNRFEETLNGGTKVTYENTNTVRAGIEFTPNRFDVRNYLRRISYRIGGRYSQYYQAYHGQQLGQFAVTAGLGFPIRFMGASSINVGVEYGCRGNNRSITTVDNRRVGLIRQDYCKVWLGVSLFGEDYWFIRPKYD